MRKCKYFLSDLEQNQKCDKIKTVKQKLKHRKRKEIIWKSQTMQGTGCFQIKISYD